MTNKIIKEQQKNDYEQGIQNAESLMENASMDTILALGGVLVDN